MSGDRIWKFPVPMPGQVLDVCWPLGAEVAHVAWQLGQLYAWLRVNPEAPKQHVSLATVGTGHPFPASAEHIGTVLDQHFVWHVLVARGEEIR